MEPFIGRRLELQRLSNLVRPGAAVTVLGTAGTGKSRLAAELARGFDGRVVWAEVDSLPALMGAPPDLVVFDDPGVGSAARAAMGELALRTRVLITSRDVVGLSGEQVLVLGPLPAPDARTLLLARLPGAGGPLVDAVVTLTDGLPGALAVVAAAAAHLSLREIVDALDGALERVRAAGGRLTRSATMDLVHRWWEECRPA